MDGFQQRKEMKRKAILEAALSLFMKHGVQKVSVSKIAQEANVSQVTIYNYFESKDNLIHEVTVYYIDKEWQTYERLLHSDQPFPEKIKQIIFNKTEVANHIHEDFYQYFMKDYAEGDSYVEQLYKEKAIPGFITLFEEGRKKGYIDPELSNEAILFFIQMMKEYMQRKDIYEQILPMTEEIMNLLFYGIVGKKHS